MQSVKETIQNHYTDSIDEFVDNTVDDDDGFMLTDFETKDDYREELTA